MEDFDVRAVVLVGELRVVVWDTLAHPAQMADVGALAGGRPLTVVYSHADWDHAWGTHGLGSFDEVVAHESAAARFITDVPAELARRREARPGAYDGVVLVPPTRTFAASEVVDLGGITLELYALPGHTPDCIVGWVPEWGVLLAGDTVETPLPVVNDGGAVWGWVEELRAWRGRVGNGTVVPSHGRVGGGDLLAETVAYLDGLLAGAPDPGVVLTPFYSETHARNVALVREAEGGR